MVPSNSDLDRLRIRRDDAPGPGDATPAAPDSFRAGKRLLPVAGDQHLVAEFLQQRSGIFPYNRIILHEQHRDRLVIHAERIHCRPGAIHRHGPHSPDPAPRRGPSSVNPDPTDAAKPGRATVARPACAARRFPP